MVSGDALPGQLRRFGYLELDGAPTGAGVYAWYLDFPAGAGDWTPRIVDGTDEAVASTTSALLDFAAYLRPRRIRLSGAGDYDLSWAGELEPDYLDDVLRNALAGKDTALTDLVDVLHAPAERQALGEALRAMNPVFSAPIYIGVAQELRARLAAHKHDYERAHRFLSGQPENRQALLASPKFGVRLAAAEVPVDHLSAYTLEIGADTQLRPDRRRAVAHVLERLLQRAFRPLYGRR